MSDDTPRRPKYTREERRAAVEQALAKMAELKDTLEELREKIEDPSGP